MTGSPYIPAPLCQWSCLAGDIPVGIYVVEMTPSRSWNECVYMWFPIVPHFGGISIFSGTEEGNCIWKEMPFSATEPHFISLPKQKLLSSPVINFKLPGYTELKSTNASAKGRNGGKRLHKKHPALSKNHTRLQQNCRFIFPWLYYLILQGPVGMVPYEVFSLGRKWNAMVLAQEAQCPLNSLGGDRLDDMKITCALLENTAEDSLTHP